MAALDFTAEGASAEAGNDPGPQNAKPQRTALYRHFDSAGRLLYVGISLSAINRLWQHERHSNWFAAVAMVRIEWLESRELALQAERLAVIKERPAHNIQHKAGKLTHREVLAMAAQRSRAHLTGRVVAYKPLYTLEEVAAELRVSMSIIRREIAEGRLACVEILAKTRTHRMVTGWQLIDYIEAMQARATT